MLIDPLTEEADARIACSKSWYALDPWGPEPTPSRIFSGYCHLYWTSTNPLHAARQSRLSDHWSPTIGFRTTLTLRE